MFPISASYFDTIFELGFTYHRIKEQLLAVGFQNLILRSQSEVVLHQLFQINHQDVLLFGLATWSGREGVSLLRGLACGSGLGG